MDVDISAKVYQEQLSQFMWNSHEHFLVPEAWLNILMAYPKTVVTPLLMNWS